MELDAGIEVELSTEKIVDKPAKDKKDARPHPIRKPVGNSFIQAAAAPSPVILKINDTPAVGRMWFVKKVSIFGTDGHTAVVNTPGLAPNQIPLGASGTATYNNNSTGVNQVISGGTVTAIAINGTTTGQTSGTFFVPAGGTVTVTYTVAPTTFTTNALTGTSALADIYIGALEELGGVPITDFSTQIVPGALIPSVSRFGRYDQPLSAHEYVYAILYSVPANQQIALIAEVDEWLVEDQEAMYIP